MNHIFDQHQKWIKIAKTFGAGEFSEDFVQDAYIKALKKETVNEALFYFILRDVVVDELRKDKRTIVQVDNEQFLTDKLYSYIDTFHPYDRKMYLIYIETKLSMRDIANQTGISLRSVFETIKSCNKKLKHYIENEYEIQH